MHANFIGIVFGLGFVGSFAYFTTNFTQVQRGMAARNTNAARRTPLIGAFPKLLFPLLTVIPGLIALVLVPNIGSGPGQPSYNDAIPLLMSRFLPNGVLGIAVTGLLASFMAGMAANVSSFSTVVTYDITQTYLQKDRPDRYYLVLGRIAPAGGVLLAVATAFLAASYSNIMNYLQNLFAVFNVPLFATFIIALFWRRMSAWAGFWGLLAGSVAALTSYLLYSAAVFDLGSPLNASFWNAGIAFTVDAIVSVCVTLVTEPKPAAELEGLVWTRRFDLNADSAPADRRWYRSPALLGSGALAGCAICYLIALGGL
jgi:SSS family solute:Na+ symporter